MTLIGAAKEHGIEFIYAISPGLDITFSNQKEVSALKRKLDQVLHHFMWREHRQCIKCFDKIIQCLFLSLCSLLRFLTLAASHLPYFLMILTTICALLTKRYSAHLHTLRFPSPTKSTSTWESPKPFSSVPQVSQLFLWLIYTMHNCWIHTLIHNLFVFVSWNPEYCGTFCYPSVSQSPYLHTVGEKLLPGIDVLWTGEAERLPNTIIWSS